MSKKKIITLFLLLAAINANAQFLFRISGNKLKEPSYILGSLHILPGSLLDSIPAYLEAEARCKQLYAELDLNGEFEFSENAKHLLADDNLFEGVIDNMDLPEP